MQKLAAFSSTFEREVLTRSGKRVFSIVHFSYIFISVHFGFDLCTAISLAIVYVLFLPFANYNVYFSVRIKL